MGQNAGVVEGDRPAPGRLEGLRMLLNTDDRFHGFDRFDDLDMLHPFLLRYGALAEGETLTPREARVLRDFRDVVRAYLIGPDEDTIAPVNSVAQQHPVVVRVGAGGTSSLVGHAPPGVAARVVARQLETLHSAIVDGRWDRLGCCERQDCQWIFYDRSRNRSARWCSAEPCGDVMKARAWRER